MASDVWTVIHTERGTLAEDLDGLTAEQWATGSLCADWSVHQTLGHIVATTKVNPPKFFGGFLAAGFKFNKFNAKNVSRETLASPEATLAEFRSHLLDTSSPPGPTESMVGEIVIHSADIRRPLGIAYSAPIPTVRRVADFYRGSNLIVGAKSRIDGLTLRATDTDWSTGTGPEVSGPIMSLVLAMTGRPVGLADLQGDGVPMLTSRMPAG